MKAKCKILFLSIIVSLILSACSSITLEPNTVEMKVGECVQIAPETKDTPIIYESNDSSIASVDENGSITAVNAGSATITATNSKGKTVECQVNVSHVLPNRIKFVIEKFTINPEESINISFKVQFIPQNTSDRFLTYSTDNPQIATVDENGIVTGVNSGTTTVTATSSNGIRASCTIVVLPYAETISIDPTLELVQQKTKTLIVAISPKNCVHKKIIWTSSDESIAKVYDGKITAVGIGTAVITAETAQTHLVATCTVTVTPPPLAVGLSMAKSSSVVGSSYQVNYNISADASGGSGKGYSYKFEIIQNGKVTKSTGWTSNNGISGALSGNGTCEVRVSVKDSTGEMTSTTKNMLS